MSLVRRVRSGIVTPLIKPVVQPLSLDELKETLNIPTGMTEWDNFLNRANLAATSMLSRRLELSFMDCSLRIKFNQFTPAYFSALGRAIPLRFGPVREIEQFRYVDRDGVTQTLDPSQYILDTDRLIPVVYPAFGVYWPIARLNTPNAVLIDYSAGAETADEVPDEIKMAIATIVAEFYERRSVMALEKLGENLCHTVDALTGHLSPRLKLGAF